MKRSHAESKRPIFFMLLTMGVLIVAAFVSLTVGPVTIPFDRLWSILSQGPPAVPIDTETAIIWKLRIPRILLSVVVGAALGAAGAGYQGLFRNPLADPFVIGASSGAALGGALAMVAGLQIGVWGFGGTSIAAMTGSLLAVAVVYAIASVNRDLPLMSLLLAGVAVSQLLGAVVALVMFLNNEQLGRIFSWLMGSMTRGNWSVLKMTTPLVLISTVALWLHSRSLDALTFGEETAAGLGLQLTRFRATVVIAATLATSAAVSACGIVGFVGLVAPHVARLLVGARHAYVIPASALLGGLLLMIADDLARIVLAPTELPVGVVTALLGGPFFIYLLVSRRGKLVAT